MWGQHPLPHKKKIDNEKIGFSLSAGAINKIHTNEFFQKLLFLVRTVFV